MKTRLEQVLERYLNGREIAIWGNPTRLLLRCLKAYKSHIAETVDPQKHFVVAVDDADYADFEQDPQSEPFEYVKDCTIFNDHGGELPFEWECHGVKVGRQSYFGEGVAGACKDGFIESIGHFTSINHTAEICVNHHLNMTFISDDIEYFFTEENKALFHDKLNSDLASPYARNKPKITIGNDVYIGAFAFINASKVTTIGDGAIIGTGAVVLEDVPPYAVVVGVPGKIKRYRYSPEMIEILLRVKWWNWSEDEINANIDALMSPEVFQERFGGYNVEKQLNPVNPHPGITKLIIQDINRVSSKAIQDFRLISADSGVYVYRCMYDGIPAVVKYFEKEADRREILNYRILAQHGIPTIKTLALGEASLVMEDISVSEHWRLGIEEDFNDADVAKALARWYFAFHEGGAAVAELNTLYSELDSISEENLKMLIKKLPEARELFEFVLTHLDRFRVLIN